MTEAATSVLASLRSWLAMNAALTNAEVLPTFPDQAPDQGKRIVLVALESEEAREWLGDRASPPGGYDRTRQSIWALRVEAWARSNAEALDVAGVCRRRVLREKDAMRQVAALAYQELSGTRLEPFDSRYPGWVQASFRLVVYRDEGWLDVPGGDPSGVAAQSVASFAAGRA